MRKFLAGVLLTFFVMSVSTALASAIKTWSNGEILSSTDLNSNFSHVHSQAEALITDSKVDSSAAIAHSKLATPALLPKAFGSVGLVNGPTPCDGAAAAGTACTVALSSRVMSVKSYGSTGEYCIELSYNPADVNYSVLASAHETNRRCYASVLSSGAPGSCNGSAGDLHIRVRCESTTAAAATNSVFSFIVLDDDN